MNMKKTIAAIAAGAMAVSAMASSVSAIELKDQVLTYSLVKTVTNKTVGTVSITGSIGNLKITSAAPLTVHVQKPDGYSVKSITVTGYYTDENTKQFNAFTRVSDANSDNYDSTVGNGYVMIPISSSTSAATATGWLTEGDVTITVTAVLEHNKDKLSEVNDELSQFAVRASNDAKAYREAFVDTVADGVFNKNGAATDKEVMNNFWKEDNDTLDGAKSTVKDADPKAYTGINAATFTKAASIVAGAFTAQGTSEEKRPFATYSGSQNKNIAEYLQTELGYTNVIPVINDAIANYGTVTFTFHTAAQPIAWKVEGDGEAFGLEKSSWNNTVITRDANWNTIPETKVDGYNTALIMANGDASKVVAIYAEDYYGDKSYTSFTQHLYNGTNNFYGAGTGWKGFADEGTGFYGGLWGDNNLFGGALVINENLTMRLSDVDMFDYTETTLSFDWDAISADATNYNAYATYVQSIKLATSTTWYWDKMDITLADVMAADATGDLTVGEGDVANETPVDDTDDAGEEITDPADDIEEPADEPEEPADEPADEAPAEVAPNPTTGNAPVALAVIPVALAAAAVVAKKRG